MVRSSAPDENPSLLVAWQHELMEQVVVKARLLDGALTDGCSLLCGSWRCCGCVLVSTLGQIPVKEITGHHLHFNVCHRAAITAPPPPGCYSITLSD